MTHLRLEKFDTSKNYIGMKTFDCGNEMINAFVQKSLKKRVKKHLSHAYVLLDKDENERFVGFYTLDSFSIARDDFDSNKQPSGLPPVIPVVKLSMLGLDRSMQGQGIGKRLLKDVFLKVYQISQLAGCAGVYLLAEKDAVSFYRSLGFIGIKADNPLPMFLNIEIILDFLKNVKP